MIRKRTQARVTCLFDVSPATPKVMRPCRRQSPENEVCFTDLRSQDVSSELLTWHKRRPEQEGDPDGAFGVEGDVRQDKDKVTVRDFAVQERRQPWPGVDYLAKVFLALL
jgi:hypothetical protein